MTIPMLTDNEAKAIVGIAFDAHSACGCGHITHALATAAHDILTAEFKALAASRIGRRIRRGVSATVDNVWNSKGEANVRLVQSAHWRAFWFAFEAGLLRLNSSMGTHDDAGARADREVD